MEKKRGAERWRGIWDERDAMVAVAKQFHADVREARAVAAKVSRLRARALSNYINIYTHTTHVRLLMSFTPTSVGRFVFECLKHIARSCRQGISLAPARERAYRTRSRYIYI
jgi:hypothetical protein